jgi:hypothetical protein
VPDRWITCPACEARVKVSKEALASPVKSPSFYRVDVLYNYERSKDSQFFGRYENAYAYARRMILKSDVYATQIIYEGRIVGTMMLDRRGV